MTQTIEIVISPQGEAKIETKGYAGSSCRAASQFLEQALGIKASEQLTAEFHQQQSTDQAVQQRGGA